AAHLLFDGSGRFGRDERTLRTTTLGALTRVEPKTPGPRLEGAERALALVLALSLHDLMQWGPAPEDDEESDRPGPDGPTPDDKDRRPTLSDESLVDHCFRTGHPWHIMPSRFFNSWGDKDLFILYSLFGEQSPIVFHGNRECQITKGQLTPRFGHGPSPYSNRAGVRDFLIRKMRLTDTDDATTVFGGTERLENVVGDTLKEHPDEEVRILSGCDAHVVGDDVIGTCRIMKRQGCRVTCLKPPMPRFSDSLGRNWWEVFLEAGDRTVEPLPDTVNLVGFDWPGSRVSVELEDLLARVGVRVAASFLPGCVPGLAEQATRARVTIASPWTPVQQVIVPVLRDKGFEVLSPPAPYGEAGTRAWVDAVVDALGLPRPSDDDWARWREEIAGDIERLRREASGITAGLIADRGTVAELRSPSFFFGFDPGLVLADLGLNVVLAGHNAAGGAMKGDHEDRISQVEYDPETDPMPLIREHGMDLVWCDLDDTTHVKREGASPISIRDFQPGLAGAARTLGRLLSRARIRLYGRQWWSQEGEDDG
ncbi:MAG: hypothetical protein GXP54_10995, partial [Deltaproteobacteria bacterium]|nr:hypothetical protein [Deltaproteobacteria bacterium]